MTLSQLGVEHPAVALLQRSLERGRLGHAYLFTGADLQPLVAVATALAQTLNCAAPLRRGPAGQPLEGCGQCPVCRKIREENHPDVHWLRPESKTRIIQVEHVRGLIRELNLRPAESAFKIAIIVAAERMRAAAANAFLKTLEEPTANTLLLLLSTEPQQLLETILSRCLRVHLAGGGQQVAPETEAWLRSLASVLANSGRSLLERYRLLGVLSGKLAEIREKVEKELRERSPLARYEDADPELVAQWEEELKAAIEAEYRRQRGELMLALEWWLRDVWLACQGTNHELAALPSLADATRKVAARLKPEEAGLNLRVLEEIAGRLQTNAQEALVLEVGLLKMKL